MSYHSAGGSWHRTDISGVLLIAAMVIFCFLGTMPVNGQVRVSPAIKITPATQVTTAIQGTYAIQGTSVIAPEQDSPVANFSVDVVSGPSPLTVQFTDTSLNNPDSWLWDFNGDGLIDDQTRNPRYTYQQPGVYTVSLIAANRNGRDEEKKPRFITVEKQVLVPAADFSAEPIRGTTPLTVRFSDQSHNAPASFAWDFNGDNIIDSSERDPVFTYTDPGVYSVTLTVRSTAGSDTIAKKGYILAEKSETIPETISATPSPADTTSSPQPTSLPPTPNVQTTISPASGTEETNPFPILLIGLFIVSLLVTGGFILKRANVSRSRSGEDLHIEMSGGIEYGDGLSIMVDEKQRSPGENARKQEENDDLF
jgi:PKD repeat protein